MKKTLLWQLLMLLIPFACIAQDERPVLEDFATKALEFQSFILNENVNIVTTSVDEKLTEVSAVNDKMQVLWRTRIEGYGIKSGFFKGKIAVIAASEQSFFSGVGGVLNGFLLDPATGKVLGQKTVYSATGKTDKIEETAAIFAKDGSFLKIVSRQTGLKSGIKLAAPGPFALFSINKYDNDYKLTTGVNIVELGEDLSPLSTVSPKLNSGFLFSMICNVKGDVILSWSKGAGYIEADRYPSGKTERSAMAGVPFDMKESVADDPRRYVKVKASETDPDVIYYAAVHQNSEKDVMLSVAKANFSKKTPQVNSERIDKAALKAMEKAYVVFDKKIDKPEAGYDKNLKMIDLIVSGNNVMVSMADEHYTQGTYASWTLSTSPIITVYDLDLKLKFRQIVPTTTAGAGGVPKASCFFAKDKLYVVANAKTGMASMGVFYGTIDLATGAYTKQEILPRKNIKWVAYADRDILWFGSGYIVPYAVTARFIQMANRLNYHLQLNSY